MPLGIEISLVLIAFGRQVGQENQAKMLPKSISKSIQKKMPPKWPKSRNKKPSYTPDRPRPGGSASSETPVRRGGGARFKEEIRRKTEANRERLEAHVPFLKRNSLLAPVFGIMVII